MISTSFADIFYNNCFQNGLLPVVLKADEVQALMEEAKGGNHLVTVDLEAQTVVSPSGRTFAFEIDPQRKEKMLKGLDAIGETLQAAGDIDVYEMKRRSRQPWLEDASVSVIIAGTVRVPPENLAALRPHHAGHAGRQPRRGRLPDLFLRPWTWREPGLIRVFEVWRDQAAIDAHFQAPHMALWRAACAPSRGFRPAAFAYEVVRRGAQRGPRRAAWTRCLALRRATVRDSARWSPRPRLLRRAARHQDGRRGRRPCEAAAVPGEHPRWSVAVPARRRCGGVASSGITD